MTAGAGDIRAGGAYVEITARMGAFERSLAAARAKMQAFAQKAQAAGAGLVRAGAVIAAPLAGGVAAAARFEKQMANVSTMVGDNVGPTMEKFNKAVRRMSVEFGESTEALSGGLYDILSASIPAEKAISVLDASVKAAKAGMTDTATAADALTTILNSYRLGAENASDVSDFLFSVVKRGKITFPELAQGIGMVSSTASVAGVKMDEMGAMIATMTRNGVKSQVAMTALNAIISSFLKPTEESAEAARQLGFEMNSATLRTEGLRGVMEKLQGVDPEVIAKLFPNVRAIRGIAPALQDLTGFMTDLGVMANRTGATEVAFQKMAKTMTAAFNKVKMAVLDVMVSIGQALSPAVSDLAKRARDGAVEFRKWVDANKQLVVDVAKLGTSLLIVGGALVLIGKTVGALAALSNPIALAAIAALALAEAFGLVDTGFSDMVGSIKIGGTKISQWMAALALLFLKAWEYAVGGATDAWEGFKVSMLTAAETGLRAVVYVADAISQAYWMGVRGASQAIAWLIDKINELAGEQIVNPVDMKQLDDVAKKSSRFYEDALKESHNRQSTAWDEFEKQKERRVEETAARIRAINDATAKAFRDDVAKPMKDAADKAADQAAGAKGGGPGAGRRPPPSVTNAGPAATVVGAFGGASIFETFGAMFGGQKSVQERQLSETEKQTKELKAIKENTGKAGGYSA